MAETEPPVVGDAGPIIHLDELGCLELLEGLGSVLIPRWVWGEVLHHRPGLSPGSLPDAGIVEVSTSPSARLLGLIGSPGLHRGESKALALMGARQARLLAM